MRRVIYSAVALALVLCACRAPGGGEDTSLRIAATTYPVYLFTTAVAGGVDGVSVELMVNQSASCLHDYTLSIRDMKLLDRADVVVMNGVGLEEFLASALAQTSAPVVDCSVGMELLPAQGHEAEYDPHFWMCRAGARCALENIASELSRLDPDHRTAYCENLSAALALLDGLPAAPAFQSPYLITFHDGFQYFARENGLTILKAIEEEEGATASAAELKEVLALVRDYRLPAIFVEANGSDTAANAIARESGCKVYSLDMIMSGAGTGLQPWLDAMSANRAAVAEALEG